ncbi:MAG: fused signal recognition particle receptor [Pyrinomonadaceae bacterium]|jgi:fused signal recognition particle receptor|nr:fused signal recognition particle receptor [Pyrinomonadaceae bacterium]
MAFWRRKKEDRYITLGLNEPSKPAEREPATTAAGGDPAARPEPPANLAATDANTSAAVTPAPPALEPTVTGGAPTPLPQERTGNATGIGATVSTPATTAAATSTPAAVNVPATTTTTTGGASRAGTPDPSQPGVAQQRPVPTRSSFSTSILGLDRSIEELQAEEAALERTFEKRFKNAISATRESLSEKIDTVFQGRKQIDAELLDELEEALIAADIGVPTTLDILDTVRRGITRKEINDIEALKAAIKNQLLSILRASEAKGVAAETLVPENISPYVMMIVGVNGVGKTTTIGKLAQRIKAEGNDVLICAADTFRAAASDQLAIWAERTGVPLIQQKQGTDPAAVLFDSLKAAKARNSDVLIVDTAGRLHNKSNLMAELEKMKRVAGREVEGAPHETLLVIDAVTGQNGLEQARQFLKVAGVTGIVLTKLDGTAKGGIAVAISKELGLPIRYAGIGEKVDDLVVFNAEHYVDGLFESR